MRTTALLKTAGFLVEGTYCIESRRILGAVLLNVNTCLASVRFVAVQSTKGYIDKLGGLTVKGFPSMAHVHISGPVMKLDTMIGLVTETAVPGGSFVRKRLKNWMSNSDLQTQMKNCN
jgi:hypothetical protein